MMLKKILVPAAREYVKEVLNVNNALCRCLSSCIDLEANKNVYFSYLPEGTFPSDIKDFSRGGVFQNAASTELAEYLWDKLNNEKYLVILFDDVMAKQSDDYLHIEESAKFFINQEVYHYVNNTNGSEKKILDLIYATGVSWHFLAVILKDNNLQYIHKNINKLPSDCICQNLSEIIIGAFDGEGYIHFVKSLPADNRVQTTINFK